VHYFLTIWLGHGGTTAQPVRFIIGCQAAACRQIELPAVHRAGARDLAEPAEISSRLGPPALDDPVLEVDVLGRAFGPARW
jgi:hypothetical protein